MLGFRYYLLSPSHTDTDNIERLNIVYQTWATTFRAVVEDAGGKFNPDDFYRHHFIGSAFYGQELVGFHLGTAFDLRLQSSREHHYLKELPASVIKKIEDTGANSLLSLEYMNILPNWRRHNHSVSWFSVLFGLGLEVFERSSCESVICMPRLDRKADEITSGLGCYTIEEKIDKMGYPCSVMLHAKGQRKFPNQETKEWIEQLWETRTDALTSNIFKNTDTQPLKKVA